MKKFLIVTGVAILLLGFFAAWLVYTPWGGQFVVRQAARHVLGSKKMSFESFQGSLAEGIRIVNMDVRFLPYLPEGSYLLVQTVSVRLTELALDGFQIDVDNARLFPGGDESLVFNARLIGRAISGNIYTHGLDLWRVREMITPYVNLPRFYGSLRDIDLFLGGTLDRPEVSGSFIAEKIRYSDFTLKEVPARAELFFSKGLVRWGIGGKLFLDGGSMTNDIVTIDIRPSRLVFSGNIARPDLDISAESVIARTRVFISVRGPRAKPDVVLTSDPSCTREQLLLMLATGKGWPGFDDFSGKQKVTPTVASNVVDYFLFGGERAKMIRSFGLSGISLAADEKKQGIVFSKNVTDRLGVDYGIEMESNERDQRSVVQRLEGEYWLTNHLLMGVQKEIKGARPTEASSEDSPGTKPSGIDLPDDRVFIKYRRSF